MVALYHTESPCRLFSYHTTCRVTRGRPRERAPGRRQACPETAGAGCGWVPGERCRALAPPPRAGVGAVSASEWRRCLLGWSRRGDVVSSCPDRPGHLTNGTSLSTLLRTTKLRCERRAAGVMCRVDASHLYIIPVARKKDM